MILVSNTTSSERKVVCHDIEGSKFEVLASELSFRPSVYAIIIKGNKTLLSKQLDGYDFAGGGVDLGETLEEALIREVKEETGLEVKVGKLVLLGDSFFRKFTDKKFVHVIYAYYLCEVTGGALSTEFFDEHEKNYAQIAEWIDINAVDKLKFYNAVDSPKLLRKARGLLQKA
ncbi:MAG: NUDIX domain-containing protein [Candidatus Micrarchaeia archaeon]|jgi:8-oxo-dGTP diphosphatase